MAKRGRKRKAEASPEPERVSVLTDETARRDEQDAALLSAVLRGLGRSGKCALWGFAACLMANPPAHLASPPR